LERPAAVPHPPQDHRAVSDQLRAVLDERANAVERVLVVVVGQVVERVVEQRADRAQAVGTQHRGVGNAHPGHARTLAGRCVAG
jgi:hypothetical protein